VSHLRSFWRIRPAWRTLSGAILLHAQKRPPTTYPPVSLTIDDGFLRSVSIVGPLLQREMNVRSLICRLIELFDDYIHEIVLARQQHRCDGDVIEELAHNELRISRYTEWP